ncbi:dynamin family protein [Microbacterium sp. W1N]|uniref:dynamin family protein n=1 Tax=Microbacterium festucae TaxID=2977531 RepID=UPI0021C10A2C|nr:dynamin family protein [Microbacterium festucae]MCT9818967.1 dynamin family protein [Microbacterium festucae]
MNIAEDARLLLDEAAAAYDDDTVAQTRIAQWRARLDDPLRLGIAGMVKAGKSTLLNAMLGERVAPTDAGECTRAITWYRYGDTPAVTARRIDGTLQRLALRRTDGRLVFDLGDTSVDDIERIDVRWPSVSLRSIVLIDTPGIESVSERVSARTRAFLLPADETASDADAIVYLLRHLHTSDVAFLEAFRDGAAGTAHTVNALAVLSRADEVGAGRLDAMLSARKIAERYRDDPQLRALALTVLPVAGLLAETARTLREREFQALRALAALDRSDRERMLLSVDRFTRGEEVAGVTSAVRRALVDRLGISGIRLAAALVRGGARSAQQLSEQLLQQSGLEELRGVVHRQFRGRQAALKVRSVLGGLEGLLRDRPHAGAGRLEAGIERLAAESHELRELDLLARSRATGLGLPGGLDAEAERVLGAEGTEAVDRLGLPAGADRDLTRARALELLERWRVRAESPLTSAAHARVCAAVVRSLEGVASEVGGAAAAARPAPHVDAAGGPAQGRGQEAHEQGEHRQSGLQQDDHAQRVGRRAGAGELEPDHADPRQQQQRGQQHPARTATPVHE